MAGRNRKIPAKKEVKRYVHSKTKRTNNPPAGLAKKEQYVKKYQKYSFDPHIKPRLDWSGKQEGTSFDVDTVSIHVHERIDPSTIFEKVRKQKSSSTITEFFDSDENNLPLHQALEFYEHEQNWSNRMIAGDSLLIMNSLLGREKMEGKVQMIYFDPPYGVKYGSNFQPFVGKHNVKFTDNDDDLTSEPEVIKAFRDTWELGIHSYLSYLRQRLLVAKDLLTESGSIFVQISDENVHHVRELMDEIFGSENFTSLITFKKTTSSTSSTLSNISDYIIWYAKNKKQIKYRELFHKDKNDKILKYDKIELPDGTRRPLTKLEKDTQKFPKGKLYILDKIQSPGESKSNQEFKFNGKKFYPRKGSHWSVSVKGLERLAEKNRLVSRNDLIYVVKYLDDFPEKIFTNMWDDTVAFGGGYADDKIYVVQTSTKVIQRCMLMTTDPGDLVFDPTCGSGTTAYVAEKFGRRYITCDTSKVALNLAQRRLMTSVFDYYELINPKEGICSGFNYKTIPHIIRSSVAYDKPAKEEILYDRPHVDESKQRISGPFTVEAIPSPVGKSIDVLYKEFKSTEYDYTSYQQEWRDEILKAGVRLGGNKKIEFIDIEQHPATKYLHAIAKTKEDKSRTAVISFGPPYSALTQKHVEFALHEVETLRPKPDIVIFAAMQFDPEAWKNIKQTKWKDIRILSVNMNTDLLVKNLKKKQKSNESFWEIGQPDAKLEKQKDGTYVVKVVGFDYYDTSTGQIVSGNASKISMWLLDTDYDERSIYPEQMFFTMNVKEKNNEIELLTKTLHGEIDPDLIEKYTGFESLPFEAKLNQKIAVKIIDDKGIPMIKVLTVEK